MKGQELHPVTKTVRSCSLPSKLSVAEVGSRSSIIVMEKKVKVNRVKPVLQVCKPSDIIKRNQRRGHTGVEVGKSEPSLGIEEVDSQSVLSYISTEPVYKVHNKACIISGGFFGRDYRIDLDDFKEASDSSDDSDADYESDSFVEDHRPRRSHHHWEGRYDFIFSMLAYHCNLNILWRFPYMTLLCGGGSFLVVVVILTCLLGFPLLLLESSVGQLTRSGPVRAMERICTLSQGLGIAMSLASFTTSVYSNIFLAWSLKLLVASTNAPLRWEGCSQIWNDNKTCVEPGRDIDELDEIQTGEMRGIVPAKNMENYFEDSPIEQYFYTRVLNRDHQNWSSFFSVRGEIGACLVVLWIWIYVSTWKRRKTSNAWRLFTIVTLYSFIILALIKTSLQAGAAQGLNYFFIPQTENLCNPAVWCFGLGYVCNMYGLGFGVPMELAASNLFNHKNLIKDVLVIIAASLLLSVLAGATVMSGAGNIAASKRIGVNDLGYNIETVFIVYIHMLSDMPFPQLFLVSFFALFLLVGLSTQFFQLDLLISAIHDNFWPHLNKYLKSREILSVFICCIGFFVSLVFCTPAGQFLLYLTDIHVAIYTPVLILAIEIVFLFWVYGWKNILISIEEMTGTSLCPTITFIWSLVISVSIIALMMCQVVTTWSVLPSIFPVSALIFGVILTSIPVLIFIVVFLKIFTKLEGKTLKTKLRIGLQTNLDACSCHGLVFIICILFI